MSDIQTFGSWVKRRRRALDLTQLELAKLVGCSESAILKIELGQRRPSRQIAERLVTCLEIPPEERQAFFSLARLTTGPGGAAAAGAWPGASSTAHPNNLPAQVTSLVGREAEIRRVIDYLVGAARLVTLVGPGGIGKTRLGLEVGSRLVSLFRDGIYFAPLSSIRDPGLVVSTISQCLGVREVAGRPLIETLKSYLREREMLLVLDNFEQVLEAAPVLSELLAAAKGLKILVTSRTMLHLYGEQQFHVPPLQMPDSDYLPPVEHLADYEAVRLFIERAGLVNPELVIRGDPGQVQAVVEICNRLDGLPLAIELAAARTDMLTPVMMLGRLAPSPLGASYPRLGLLTGGPRDLPPRQQTLRNAIEWSFRLLDDTEQRLFTGLAVFTGGCTEEAAEEILSKAVSTAMLAQGQVMEVERIREGLTSLVSKSLLVHRVEERKQRRFFMLETIHEYAREKLAEAGASNGQENDELHALHAQYYLALAEEAEGQLSGSRQAEWLALLEEEHDNLRSALRWAREKDEIDIALRMSGALWRFWLVRGHYSEGREQLESTLKLAEDAGVNGGSGFLARALNGAAVMAWRQNDYDAAVSLSHRALEIYREVGDKVGIAQSLHNLGNVAHRHGDYAASTAYFTDSLVARREAGDKHGVADSLNNLAMVIDEQGDHDRARTLYEESLTLYKELGDRRGVANSLVNLGFAAWGQHDLTGAAALYEESVPIYRELGDRRGIANALTNMGLVAWERGDYDAASSLLKESLTRHVELEDRQGVAECLEGLARVAGFQGESERAAELWGAAEALREAIGIDIPPGDRPDYEEAIQKARSGVDEPSWLAAWDRGRAMSVEQAIGSALGESQ